MKRSTPDCRRLIALASLAALVLPPVLAPDPAGAAANFQIVTASQHSDVGKRAEIEVACPSGTKVISGGSLSSGGDTTVMRQSFPKDDQHWKVIAGEISWSGYNPPIDLGVDIVGYAICSARPGANYQILKANSSKESFGYYMLQSPTCPARGRAVSGGVSGDNTEIHQLYPAAEGAAWATEIRAKGNVDLYSVCVDAPTDFAGEVLSQYEIVHEDVDINGSAGKMMFPTCPFPKRAIAGGVLSSHQEAGRLEQSYPSGQKGSGNHWVIEWHNERDLPEHVQPDAVCARVGNDDPQALLCENGNYGGRCEIFTEDDPDLRDNAIGNDTVSSIRQSSDFIAIYQDINYGGLCQTHGGDNPWLGDDGPETLGNDAVSSIRLNTKCERDSLPSGEALSAGQGLRSSNGRYRLWMQQDGNLVVRNAAGEAIWSTGTWGRPGAVAVMQTDGNLVLYHSGAPVWSTGTWDSPGARLVMQSDGNLVLRTDCCARWWTGTVGR